MSDLLSIGRSGVIAYQAALSTVSENVANSQTEGYSRRTTTLKEVTASGGQAIYRANTSFGGVNATSVQRAWDDFKASDARASAADDGRADARMRWLTTTESALNDGAAGVGKQLTSVYTSADALAADPSSTAARTQFLAAIDGATSAMRTSANALANASKGVTAEASVTVDAVNADLVAIANINQTIGRTQPGTTGNAQAADERDRLISDLSAKLGVDVTLDGQGRARVTLAGSTGTVLVDGMQASRLGITTSSDGLLTLSLNSNTGDTPIYPTAGSFSGLIDVAATIADRRQTLDGIAAQFTTEMNGWQAAGLTDAGVAGANLVTPGTGGAATIALATTDVSAIAAASPTTSIVNGVTVNGTVANGNLLALQGYRGTNSVETRWSTMVTGQAQSTSAAKSEATAASSRKDSALASLDAVSGVDLDREAADLLRFQQAYSASSKIIQVAKETLQSILSLF